MIDFNYYYLNFFQVDRQSKSAILWIQKIQRFPKKRELLIIIQKIQRFPKKREFKYKDSLKNANY